MTQTTHYHLNKFEATDKLNPTTLNGLNDNADKIDTALNNKQTANLTQTISNASSNTEYPSAQAVYDYLYNNYQPAITNANKLSSDLVDETGHTNTFIKALPSGYSRIWDLDTGVYKCTAGILLYYNGATDTTDYIGLQEEDEPFTHTKDWDGFLVVSSDNDSRGSDYITKYWYLFAQDDIHGNIWYGHTTKTTGDYEVVPLDGLQTFTGTDGNTAGSYGLVPAPFTTDAGKFLCADGTWQTASGSTSDSVTLQYTDNYGTGKTIGSTKVVFASKTATFVGGTYMIITQPIVLYLNTSSYQLEFKLSIDSVDTTIFSIAKLQNVSSGRTNEGIISVIGMIDISEGQHAIDFCGQTNNSSKYATIPTYSGFDIYLIKI